jgi:putative ABC transport system substrate-binding protein
MRRRQFIGLVGGVAAVPILRPLAVSAQQAGRPYRIAYLALLSGENATFAKPLLQRLEELGFHEGKNMIWDYRSAEGRVERLPVGAGLVASLGQPGGNVTGMSGQASEIAAKKLQLLDDLIPGKKLVAVLGNPDTPYTALALRQVKAAATAIGLPIAVLEARTIDQIQAAIDQAINSRAASMLVLEDPVLLSAIQRTTELAAKGRLPAIYGPREYAQAGGLISYGTDQSQLSRRAAEYVDRILKGASPASLPVEQPTKFELVINLRTAKALGLEIPSDLLSLADELIE